MAYPKPAWRPAPRDGVAASCVALPPGEWPSLLSFLAWRLPVLDEAGWAERLQAGEVLDLQGGTVPPDAPYRPNTKLWYWRRLPHEPVVPFAHEVLYQDDCLLVVDKPHFLAMVPKGRYARETLLARLTRELGLTTLSALHRLDRETAGVVMFSVREDVRDAYHGLFRDRAVHKVYEAVAPWRADLDLPLERHSRLEAGARVPGAHFMQVHEVPGEVNASTRIELIEHDAQHGWYRLTPHTGQTHQLRVHMHALGLPLRGDRIYPRLWPDPAADAEPDYRQPLQLLAREIRFTDPISGRAHCFRSRRQLQWPLPLDSLTTS